MFNKKLKLKIEKLESEIQELILRSNKFTDIINDNFIGIEGKKQVPIFGWSSSVSNSLAYLSNKLGNVSISFNLEEIT